jgi:hypothetical protein
VNCFVASSNATSGVLYAGGLFSVTGIHTAANIAKKTITTPWDTAGSNTFDAGLRALCFFNGYLVAGGDFTSPGAYVARYATTVDVEEIADNILVNTVYPNPLSNESILNVRTKNELHQPILTLMGVKGDEIISRKPASLVNSSQNEAEFKISREGLASGIYYYMVLDEERIIATGKVIAY